jgi:hypothetical protein
LLPLSLLREGNSTFNEFEEGKQELLHPDDRYDAYNPYYFVTDRHNNVLSAYPVFTGILVTPVYFLYSLWHPEILQVFAFDNPDVGLAAYVSASMLTFLTLLAMYFIVFRESRSMRASVIATIIFAFATPVVSVTSRFLSTQTASLLFITYGILCFQHKKTLFGFACCCGAFLSRPHTVILILPLYLSLVWRELPDLTRSKSRYLRAHALTIALTGIIGLMAVAVTWAQASVNSSGLSFSQQYALNRFSGNINDGLTGILFSPGRGLFVYGPFFLFSLIGMVKSVGKYLPLLVGSVAYVLLIGLWDMWWGGAGFGYRMLLELSPILVLYAYIAVSGFTAGNLIGKFMFMTALLASLFIQTILGGLYYPCGSDADPVPVEMRGYKKLREHFWDFPSTEIPYCMQRLMQQLPFRHPV